MSEKNFFLLMCEVEYFYICLKFICISFSVNFMIIFFVHFGHNTLSKLLFSLFYVSMHTHIYTQTYVFFYSMFIYGIFALSSLIWLPLFFLTLSFYCLLGFCFAYGVFCFAEFFDFYVFKFILFFLIALDFES